MKSPDYDYWFYYYRSSNRFRKDRKSERRFFRKLEKSCKAELYRERVHKVKSILRQMSLTNDEYLLEQLEAEIVSAESKKFDIGYID